jgi:hypothetical protein
MFSKRTQRPKRTPFSNVRKKFLSLNLITSMSFAQIAVSLPMFLMYLATRTASEGMAAALASLPVRLALGIDE